MTLTTHILPLVLSLCVSLPVTIPAGITASPNADDMYYPVDLEVDTTGLGTAEDFDAEQSAGQLRLAIEEYCEDERVRIVDNGDASARVRVKVEWKEVTQSAYFVSFVVRRPGSDEDIELERSTCELCGADDLVAHVTGRLPEVLNLIEVPAEPAASDPSNARIPPDDRPHDEKRMGALGGSGIGLGVLGLGAVAGGTALVLEGKPETVRPQSNRLETRNFRDPGIGVLVAGGVLLATGIALIVLDQKRLKERHDRRASFEPIMLPRGAGLGIGARF